MLDLEKSPDALSVETRNEVARAWLLRGIRQAAILRVTSAAITHAPSVDDCAGAIERARQALLHFEDACERYAGLTQGDLHAESQPLAAALPLPQNWQQAALAQWLLCAATRVELDHTSADAAVSGWGSSARSVLASTLEQMSAARAALSEAGAWSEETQASLIEGNQELIEIALATLWDEAARADYRRLLEGARRLGPDPLTH